MEKDGREIKFRAWIKVSQAMASWKMIKEKKNLHGLIENQDYLLMQYTGLKDKNGIEIYEGDIILWYGGALKHIPIYSEVKWNREEARFSFGCKANSAYMFYNTEVVGNIYENPDLLKG